MTKEMSAGRRTDILTDALLHYSARQLQQFGNTHSNIQFQNTVITRSVQVASTLTYTKQ